jgi:DNA transposition AAA+ family ATPase
VRKPHGSNATSTSSTASDFVITNEHRRFAEFCEACRRYGYIGLCYGVPGVGKTLSARSYANWDTVEAFDLYGSASDAALHEVLGSNTLFYTPKVVNSPGHIAHDIQRLRERLHTIRCEPLRREEHVKRQELQQQEAAYQRYVLTEKDWFAEPVEERPRFAYRELSVAYHQKRVALPDPTTLIIIDEADRLKMAALEQVRDIFDQGGIGVIFIGMPGLEKRLSRYPQLYSRVGFVHAFRPLSAAQVGDLLQRKWVPSGVALPEEGVTDAEALAAIIRITGGNFRLIHRLLTQIARIVEINALCTITGEVVAAARESLVIGAA